MTVRLTVRTAVWRAQVAQVAHAVDGLVPVVKGNGYGFGRQRLAQVAAELSDTIAVGNVHELDGLPDGPTVVVLTPTLEVPDSHRPILTLGHDRHIEALEGWRGRVLVKLTSTMHRFGRGMELVDRAASTGLEVVGVAIHPPLTGTVEDHLAEVCESLDRVPGSLPVWVSHLTPEAYRRLPDSHTYRLRLGGRLWHGDKTALHLEADVLDVRAIAAGTPAGYRLGATPADGHLVVIGAGTANGVFPLPDGRSPFHHARTRMALHEPPHMHVSMVFVPTGDPLPSIGDWVDLQRPLHTTLVDEYCWR
jgi:alanine racemase